jgi:hydroxyacylglutathione hydrolase
VLVVSFPAVAFDTNCYLVATGTGEPCVIIDPGIGVLPRLDQLLAEYRLQPAAVLLTHGHLDHTFTAAPVCAARGVSAYIHPADRVLLADPAKGLSMSLDELFGGRLPYAEPADVQPVPDRGAMHLAGLEITVDHAPGHTPGSVMFRTDGDARLVLGGRESSVDGERLCFSGDVLFAGSIGRTDLPGGDLATMVTSLRERVLPMPDETVVLPGHGPVTTIARERATNPYLLEVADPSVPRPGRGW